jgi:hypothetical protein
MLMEQYIYKKVVDWSALNYGINIPVALQLLFYDSIEYRMKKGDTKKIAIVINGVEYYATLTNIYFDERKYPNHKELLQIRYTKNSLIAKKMREIFCSSYTWLKHEKEKLDNQRKQLAVPDNLREEVVLYATEADNVILFECITHDELLATKEAFCGYSEMELESLLNMSDDSAMIVKKIKTTKMRKLDKTICEGLKRVYEFKCQVCGEYVGAKYNVSVIHSHHIEPFSQTLNNNPDNIMIICPNHHGVVHATHPIFDRNNESFIYPNGYIEKLKLNVHL